MKFDISQKDPIYSNFVQMLRGRAEEQPNTVAYTFLVDGDRQEARLTCAELDARARKLGGLLQEKKLAGERALLLYPPGLDYIAAFFGCIYGGVIAVPAYPPDPYRLSRTLPRLKSIIHDSGTKLILTTEEIRAMSEAVFSQDPDLSKLEWRATDRLDDGLAASWKEWNPPEESPVFLQYTSGSTGSPKGVMLSHRNLMSNMHMIGKAFRLNPDQMGASWLPPYHDMGLIGGILTPLYGGGRTILMSPLDFLKKPLSWLRMIHHYRVDISGGPNFAYDLCVRKATPEFIEELDLSSWGLAFSGAEPIRAETLKRFAETFRVSGFKSQAYYPCYGLAEGTLMVSGSEKFAEPILKRVLRKSLEAHLPQTVSEETEGGVWMVGCGKSVDKQRILIVDPETEASLPEEKVGEIWVNGPSIALGYWKRPEESEKTFRARLRPTDEIPSELRDLRFLRTGDMGFLSGGELYVTGRIKDLIIIRGQNHYPQDIELSIEKSDPAFRPGCGAVFSVERGEEERLVIVWEVDLHLEGPEKDTHLEALAAKVRQSVSTNHEIQADAVVFIRKGSIYKTSSGKIQRHACRKAYLDGELETLGEWEAEKPESRGKKKFTLVAVPLTGASPAASVKVAQIREWLSNQIAERMGINPEEIDPKLPFQNFGLDSKEAVNLSGDLETLLDRRLSPTLLWQYPNIEALSEYLGSDAPSSQDEGKENSAQGSEAVAVVGMACRFPGSPDLESFWNLLREGRDGVVEVPPGRWNISAYYHPDPATPGKMNIRTGGFLGSIDGFDANFFGISPREANRMDPQQRLLLEVAWQALENAAIVPDRLAGSKTGVFVGISSTEYSHLQFSDPFRVDAYAGTGNAHSVAANRISYLLDLRGPSLAIDTACSSSLVAIHLASQSLKRGECHLAMAGGVNLLLSPELTLAFSQARMMSSKGRCATFDASADGYVRGEGAGVVILKRLSDALRDGDRIWAIVPGSAVNQDGRTNGLTAPNPSAQQAVVREALHQAGILPADLDFVEAHGTGTPLGDPIELTALGEVLKEGRSDESPCLVGSVKTNIGHLESAAGVAGFIKAALALYHGQIPPHLHFTKISEHIPFSSLPVKIPVELTPWPASGSRYAGVSSFGFGGTNAHIILSQAPNVKGEPRAERSQHLLKLTAKSAESLQQSATQTLQFLNENPDVSLSALCHTANAGRSDFENRAVVLAENAEEMKTALTQFLGGVASPSVKTAVVKRRVKPKIGFLFTGQGSQYPGMGLKLYQAEPKFKKVLDECDDVLRPILGRSLLALMHGKDPDPSLIHETGFTQPALYALGVALAELMRSWGIQPDFVMGHSVGEYVAASVAGVFSREEGLKLIAERGRLMQELPKNGGMLAARMGEAQAAETVSAYADEVSLAAVNGPQSVVFSGKKERIDALERELSARGVGVQPLTVSHAFHSPLMDPILKPFEEKASQIHFKTPRIPVISNLTGRILESGEISPAYWRKHLREAVRFADGIRFLADRGSEIFLELGPKPVLLGMGKRCFDRAPGLWLSALDSNRDDEKNLLATLGDLYLQGIPVDWKGLDSTPHAPVSLPPYPFEEKRCWLDIPHRTRRGSASAHPLLGERIPSALDIWQFESEISLERLPYLRDHRLSGQVLYPAAAYVETALAAAREYFGEGAHTLREIALEEAFFLGEAESCPMQLILKPRSDSQADFEIFSAHEVGKGQPKTWRRHARGRLERSSKASIPAVTALAELKTACSQELPRDGFYEALAKVGLEYGINFQGVRQIFRGKNQALGLVAPLDGFPVDGYQAHPALLDAAFQVLAASLPAKQPKNGGDPLFIPVGFGRISVHAPWPASLICHGSLRGEADPHAKEMKGDLKIYDENGSLLAEIEEFRLKSMAASGKKSEAEQKQGAKAYALEWKSSEALKKDLPGPGLFKGSWLIFSDDRGRGESLAKLLESSGARCLRVKAGEEFKKIDESSWMIRPDAEEDYARLTEVFAAEGLKGIVHLWGTKNYSRTDFVKDFHRANTLGALSLLKFFQVFGEKRVAENARLWIVTRGGQPVGETSELELNLPVAPLWGLGRTLALEHPELKPVLVDWDLDSDEEEVSNLFEEISNALAGDTEPQIARRGTQRFILRLKNSKGLDSASASQGEKALKIPSLTPFRLEVSPSGVMEDLHFTPMGPAELQAGQVEIEVKAAGLNFSDVLKALALYPGLKEGPVPIGIECAGKISRVAPDVSRWKKGDEVAAIAPFCFASHAVIPADYILPKPSFMSFEEAAAIPVAYLTAHYALNTLGRMQPKERVLIHAGAGGVGIAAIQLAKARGLEIFATAGSPEKRAYLKTLGVKEVFDSRSLSFAEELLQATGGEGVDLVLNSLPGEFISKSLSTLRAYGRFLEIGKIDIYQDRPMGLLPFQNNLSYFAIDLDRLFRERPTFVLGLFQELMGMFEKKTLSPMPITSFPLGEAVSAFRYMAQRKNTGKIVLSMEKRSEEKGQSLFSSEASYLITGGLGGLGLQLARWMTEEGARHFILLGRSSPGPEARKVFSEIESRGGRVRHFSVDVSEMQALEGVIEKIRSLPPLRGVFHAAGVLEDGIFENLSPEKFDKVFAPKIKGAWQLHRLTQKIPLDFFVMFSSVASVLGSPGQANYAAANAFLDALAHERRLKGLAAHSVNWGPWAGAGMAATVKSGAHDLAARGMGLIDPAEGFSFLKKILRDGAAQEVVIDADWIRLARLTSVTGQTPIFSELAGSSSSKDSDEGGAGGDLRLLSREAIMNLTPEERCDLIASRIQSHVARVLGLQPNQLDLAQPLNTLGLDSLMAIEMKNEIESTLKITLPIATLIKGPNIRELAGVLVEELAKPVSP